MPNLLDVRNVSLCYAYKNGRNEKFLDAVVFANPEGLSPHRMAHEITKADSAGGRGWFVPHQVRLGEICPWTFRNDLFNPEIDACWHVVQEVDFTYSPPNDRYRRTSSQFLDEYLSAAGAGWDEFNPMERPACPACQTENDPRETMCAECGTRLVKQFGGFGQGV